MKFIRVGLCAVVAVLLFAAQNAQALAVPKADRVAQTAKQPMAAATEIVFIQDNIEDWQVLAAGVPSTAEVVRLDARGNGLLQMAAALKDRHDLAAIHLISHGETATLDLGAFKLDRANIISQQAILSQIGSSLQSGGSLLLYGCDVAKGEAGRAFVQQMAKATGRAVAASDNLTGAAKLGGDWVLETVVGRIASKSLVFSEYNKTLSVSGTHVVVTETFGSSTVAEFDVSSGMEYSYNPGGFGIIYYSIDIDPISNKIVFYNPGSGFSSCSELIFTFSVGDLNSFTGISRDTSYVGIDAYTNAPNSSGMTASVSGKVIKLNFGCGIIGHGLVAFDFTSTDNAPPTPPAPPAPTISSLSANAAALYKTGDVLSFTVNTSANVTVSGSPRLVLDVGGVTRYASFDSSTSGSSALRFTYTIQAGDSANGISISSLDADGATLSNGSNLNLSLNNVATTSGIVLDTTAPTFSLGSPATGEVNSTGFVLNINNLVEANGPLTGRYLIRVGTGLTSLVGNAAAITSASCGAGIADFGSFSGINTLASSLTLNFSSPALSACTGMVYGTNYTLSLYLADAAGNLSNVVETSYYYPAPPAQTQVAASKGGFGEIYLTFPTPSAGGLALTGYTVSITAASLGTPSLMTFNAVSQGTQAISGGAGTITSVSGGVTTILIKGLPGGNGNTFAYSVSGRNRMGNATYSAPVSIAATAAPIPVPVPPPIKLGNNANNKAENGDVFTVGVNEANGAVLNVARLGSRITLDLGVGKAAMLTAQRDNTSLQFTVAQYQGQQVPVIKSIEGSVLFSAVERGIALFSFGQQLVSTCAEAAATSFTLQSRADKAGYDLSLTDGCLLLPGNPPNTLPVQIHAGETVLLDAAGKISSWRLGSVTGDTAQLGDAMQFADAVGARVIQDVKVPNLNGNAARLAGKQTLLQKLFEIGLADPLASSQNEWGVVFISPRDEKLGSPLPRRFRPVGDILIDLSIAEGISKLDDGRIRVSVSGYQILLAPSVPQPYRVITQARLLISNLQAALQLDGSYRIYQNGGLSNDGIEFLVRPAWGSTPDTRIGIRAQFEGFSASGDTTVTYSDQTLLTVLNPAVADLSSLRSALLSIDKTATMQADVDTGTILITLTGSAYRLKPDYRVEVMAVESSGKTWWLDDKGRIVLRNADGTSQAFAIQAVSK